MTVVLYIFVCQGVAHWNPPEVALALLSSDSQDGSSLDSTSTHRYGPALGLPALREALVSKLERENGLDMTGQEVRVPNSILCDTDRKISNICMCVAIPSVLESSIHLSVYVDISAGVT